jgi:multidrug resistance protein, MATE family
VSDGETPVTARELMRLAVPSALFVVLTNGYRQIDQYFIQDVSTEAQAAIGSSIFVLILFYAGAELIAAGAGPLVARATGARDFAGRRKTIGSALFGILALAVILSLLGGLGAELIAGMLGLEGRVAEECASYLAALSWTLLPLLLTPLVDQSFVAMGSARMPLILHALSLVLNLILTPLLIYRAGLGVTGAALAANFSRGVATAIGLWYLAKVTELRLVDLRSRSDLGRVMRIGAPIAFGTVAYSLVYWAMLKTSISPLGPEVNAALGIGFSALEGLTWPIFHGVAIAIASFVGRALGAGRPDLARAAIRRGLPVSTVLGAIAAITFFFGGRVLTGLFTEDPRVHEEATTYAMVLAASQLFVAWEALFEGVLAGAGDTKAVLWMSAPFNLIRIPLAWWLAFPLGMGPSGVWWAINVTSYAKTIAKGWATMSGRWARIQI